MTDEEIERRGWLERLMDGGLPQLFAGPAGKAISRLIGAAVDIPEAYLQRIAQGIRDDTSARSHVMDTLTKAAVELGLKDESRLQRGLNSLISKAYREQENREAVAGKVIEALSDEPPPDDSKGPDDEWLDMFESIASRASTETIRDLFARVLAGEIRQPGRVSLATLQFLTIMDAATAKLIEEVAPYKLVNNTILRNSGRTNVNLFRLCFALEERALVNTGGNTLHSHHSLTDGPDLVIGYNGGMLAAKYENRTEISLPCYSVTKVGTELMDLLSIKGNEEHNIECLAQSNPLFICRVIPAPDGRMLAGDEVWRRPSK